MEIKINTRKNMVIDLFLNIILIFLLIIINKDIYAERLNNYNIESTDISINGRLITGDFPDIVKSLQCIERAFKEKNHNYLELVTLKTTKNTKEYKSINKYIDSSCNITLNYRQEEAQKKFKINNNNNHCLVINFEKSLINNSWEIMSAHEVINDKISPIKKYSFSAGAYLRSFNDILQLIKNNKINTYLGLAPSGVVNIEYLKKNKLYPSQDINFTIKNVIIFHEEEIKGIYYFKFKFFPIGFKDSGTFKSGWLLNKIGRMESLYEKSNDLFIDYKLGKIKYSKKQLCKKSNIICIPLGTEEFENRATILTENRVKKYIAVII